MQDSTTCCWETKHSCGTNTPLFACFDRHVKDADKDIIAHIKSAGRLVDHSRLMHSYPFCWRSDTPLIYRAVPSWFVKVRAKFAVSHCFFWGGCTDCTCAIVSWCKGVLLVQETVAELPSHLSR